MTSLHDEPRRLTEEEVEEIVKRVFEPLTCRPTTIPHEVQQSVLERQQITLRYLLRRQRVYPPIIPTLTQRLRSQFQQSLVAPGESLGVICAQSIGERQTQMTLNTFHAAGMTVDTVITGVPRFLELLNASKEPKLSSTKCFLRDTYDDVHQLKERISKQLIDVHMSNLYTTFEILEHRDENYASYYPTFLRFYDDDNDEQYRRRRRYMTHPSRNGYFVRYHLHREALYRYNISTYEIAERLYRKYEDIFCIFSPNHQATLDVFMDLEEIDIPTTTDDVVVMPDTVGDEEDASTIVKKKRIDPEKLKFLNEHNKHLVYIEEVFIPQIDGLSLFGIPNIQDYFIEKMDDEFVLHTKGNNFDRLLGCPFIDARRTVSNNMWNIYTRLGIEATRDFLIEEFSNIVSSDGTFINQCHVELLVDIMTFSGTIVSVSRYGMKNDQFGPLAKASFEESLDNFLKAGFFSEKEGTTDVSASIICGKRPNMGTGLCKLLLDTSKWL